MLKIIRSCTVSLSLGFVKGLLPDLCKKYEVVLVSSPGKEMDEIVMEYGIRGISIPMERHISLIKDAKSLIILIKTFRKEKPTMVHSMTPKAGLLCMIAGWLTRVPVRVHTFTGLVFPTSTGVKQKILMLTDAITCACATHIIPEGEGVKNDLLNNGITKKPLRVLGYGNVRGIDMERFSLRPEIIKMANQLRKKDVFTFVFVGRIVRDKGMDELMVAFEQLSKERSNIRLFLVGSFEDSLDPISDRAKTIINNNTSIEYIEEKSGDEFVAYYAASDCFVFPSYREGFPNTVLEAGAMGLPSIVTDINGSREIIVNGKNGVIIPSKDTNALYHAMKKMIEDNESRQQMASNARQMIADRFEQSFVRQCLYDFYDEILSPYKR